MRVHTKYRVGQSRKRKRGGNTAAIIVCLALVVLVTWLGWKEWKRRQHPTRLLSNAPGATNQSVRAPAPASVHSLTGTVVRRIAVPMTNAGFTEAASAKSAAVLEAQVALDRLGISSGSIDGLLGAQTRSAIRTFQLREGLPQT
ncbi:MAG TPA: peptidoglycan-binding domain-containing protein, partial [Candidatus Acidoferrum sp.]|nr:peptidoglycan-binding domain-containing protein [Candidatus Acidoferrum sp.]